MTSNDNLARREVKWLTWLVYLLLTVLAILTGWNTNRINDMPEKYVRLERYLCDVGKIEKTLQSLGTNISKLDDKIDKLLIAGGIRLTNGMRK